jgi:cell division protein FtsL
LPRVAEQTRTRRQPLALQRVLLFLCAILAAGACMGLLFLKSQVLVTQRSINKIQTEITQLERSNSEMSAQVTSAQNINVIMDRARQLGMNTPKQDQVLYVALGDAERTSISAKQ